MLVAYEKGRILPTEQRLARLCAVLGVDPHAIVPADIAIRRSYVGKRRVAAGPTKRKGSAARYIAPASPEDAEREQEYRRQIGEAIRAARVRLDVSIRFVAGYVGVHTGTVTSWERGHRTPSEVHLWRLCALLQLDADAIGARPNPTKIRGQAVTHTTTDETKKIRKGTIWRNGKGATVQIHESTSAGIVRYHKLPDGELLRLSVPVFLQRYAELRS